MPPITISGDAAGVHRPILGPAMSNKVERVLIPSENEVLKNPFPVYDGFPLARQHGIMPFWRIRTFSDAQRKSVPRVVIASLNVRLTAHVTLLGIVSLPPARPQTHQRLIRGRNQQATRFLPATPSGGASPDVFLSRCSKYEVSQWRHSMMLRPCFVALRRACDALSVLAAVRRRKL